jgi:hypothetical protein
MGQGVSRDASAISRVSGEHDNFAKTVFGRPVAVALEGADERRLDGQVRERS